MCAHLSPCCPSTHCPGRAANASPAPDHQGPHAEKSGWRRRGGASVRRPPDAGIRPELPVPAPAAARLGPARGGGASRPVPGSARCSSCTVGNGVRVAVIQWALGGGASTPHAGSVGSCLSLAQPLSELSVSVGWSSYSGLFGKRYQKEIVLDVRKPLFPYGVGVGCGTCRDIWPLPYSCWDGLRM